MCTPFEESLQFARTTVDKEVIHICILFIYSHRILFKTEPNIVVCAVQLILLTCSFPISLMFFSFILFFKENLSTLRHKVLWKWFVNFCPIFCASYFLISFHLFLALFLFCFFFRFHILWFFVLPSTHFVVVFFSLALIQSLATFPSVLLWFIFFQFFAIWFFPPISAQNFVSLCFPPQSQPGFFVQRA